MRENRFIRQKFLVRKSGGRPPEVGVQAGSPPSREFTCTSIRNPAGFCNFSSAFSTVQAAIRDKPADREGTYSGGGRTTVRVMPASRAKCRLRVTTGSVPRYPATARARIPKQAGKKPGRAKPAGRNRTEKPEPTKPESGNDETEYLRGIFSDQRFALA